VRLARDVDTGGRAWYHVRDHGADCQPPPPPQKADLTRLATLTRPKYSPWSWPGGRRVARPVAFQTGRWAVGDRPSLISSRNRERSDSGGPGELVATPAAQSGCYCTLDYDVASRQVRRERAVTRPGR
jgi:hypothetical protein